MKIALVGDVMLGRLVNKMLKDVSSEYPWGDTLPIFQDADLRICNLECVISDKGIPWSTTPKMFHFRTDEKNVHTLHAAKIDIVSIANNHVLDYEYEALERMLGVLDEQGILYAGSGRNLSEASQPAFCQIKNLKIALIAFTDNEPDWAAKTDMPGTLFIPTVLSDLRMQTLMKQIKTVRQDVDFLIISAHWGSNWGYKPPQEHLSVGHALIDAGADLIFGHSGHVFRGIEIYKERAIIYSAGDFIDDYAVDEEEKNDESFIFVLEQDEQGMRLVLYPTCIDQFQAILAPPHRKKAILTKMKSLCKDLGSDLKCYPNYAILDIKIND